MLETQLSNSFELVFNICQVTCFNLFYPLNNSIFQFRVSISMKFSKVAFFCRCITFSNGVHKTSLINKSVIPYYVGEVVLIRKSTILIWRSTMYSLHIVLHCWSFFRITLLSLPIYLLVANHQYIIII